MPKSASWTGRPDVPAVLRHRVGRSGPGRARPVPGRARSSTQRVFRRVAGDGSSRSSQQPKRTLDRLSEIVDAYRAEFPDGGVVTRITYKYIEGGGAWRVDQDGYGVSSKNGSHYATKVCAPMPCVWYFDKPVSNPNFRYGH